jgi:hypothetical protein
MEKCDFRNVLAREWREHLSTDEFAFLHYVMYESLEWGKVTLDVTINQMLNGIRNPPGHRWKWRLSPVGIARRTVERLIARLKERGVLFVEAVRNRCTKLTLNLLWTPMEDTMSLSMPKRLREQQANTSDQSEFMDEITASVADISQSTEAITANQAVNNRHSGGPYKQNNKQNEESTTSEEGGSLRDPLADLSFSEEVKVRERKRPITSRQEEVLPFSPAAEPARALEVYEDRTEAAVARVKRQGIESRAEQMVKARAKDTAEAYHTSFTSAWAETYEGIACPTWNDRERNMVRSVLKARLCDDVPARHEFLTFLVRNWQQIIATEFGWMKKITPPALPSVGFFTNRKLIGNFLDAFANRAQYNKLDLLDAEEREVERLVLNGMRRDKAMIAVGERRALSKTKAEEKDVRRVNGNLIKRAEEERARLNEERRAFMREKATTTQYAPEVEGFPELGEIEPLPELPPIDYSKWN